MASNQDPRSSSPNDGWEPDSRSSRPAQHDSVNQESLTDYEDFFRQDSRGRLRSESERTAEHPAVPAERYPMNEGGGVATAPIAPSEPAGDEPKPKGKKRVRRILLWVLAGFLAYSLAITAVFAFSVTKVEAMPTQQVAGTSGTNYLLVGTDNRDNLTKKQRKQLGTGYIEGQRTDTIMVLHVPLVGEPTLVSIPRDSWVPIEGHGSDKINAAYAFGGPALLVNTVERTTGLRIDNYVEIGMDGVAEVVDALGGITLCPKANYNDQRSGLKIKKGCQEVNGKTALAYVRMRYSDPTGDIGRAERQREYIAAVGKKAMSPTTWLNPFKAFSVSNAAADSLTVDESTGIFDDTRLAVALGMISLERGESTSVPIETDAYWVGGQQAVKWDTPKALKLFESLA
ncbi:MAG: transcriptional regulator [Micrococcales bacterium]|nr:transcriptional regulator [Micrococcales bacterium]